MAVVALNPFDARYLLPDDTVHRPVGRIVGEKFRRIQDVKDFIGLGVAHQRFYLILHCPPQRRIIYRDFDGAFALFGKPEPSVGHIGGEREQFRFIVAAGPLLHLDAGIRQRLTQFKHLLPADNRVRRPFDDVLRTDIQLLFIHPFSSENIGGKPNLLSPRPGEIDEQGVVRVLVRHRNAVAVRYLPTLYGYERIRAGAQGPRIFVQTEPNKLVQTDRFILRLHDIAQVQGGVVGMTENDIHYLAQPLLFIVSHVRPAGHDAPHLYLPGVPSSALVKTVLDVAHRKSVLQQTFDHAGIFIFLPSVIRVGILRKEGLHVGIFHAGRPRFAVFPQCPDNKFQRFQFMVRNVPQFVEHRIHRLFRCMIPGCSFIFSVKVYFT